MAVCLHAPFRSIKKHEIIFVHNAHTLTIRDTLPVSPGHTLIIPKRHIAS
jgi:diadenosine tetraphosphate (Ap4A) HIT family hydrolase